MLIVPCPLKIVIPDIKMTTISTRPDTSSQEPFTESFTHKVFSSDIPQDSKTLEQTPAVKFSRTLVVVLIFIFAIAIIAAASITLYLLIYKTYCRNNSNPIKEMTNQQLRQDSPNNSEAMLLVVNSRPLPQRHSCGTGEDAQRSNTVPTNFEIQEEYVTLATAGLPNQPGHLHLVKPLDVGSVIRPGTGASESRQDTAPDYAIISAPNTIPDNSSGDSHPSPLRVGEPTIVQVHPTNRINSQVRVQLVIKLSSWFLTG